MIRAIISFLAGLLTAIQAVLLYTGAKGLCFNDACAIVDSMTNIPPIFFNIGGFLFFLTLFWLFLLGRKGSEYWHKFARLLLLSGLTAEAVLVFFQHSIARVFCSYCLVIFAIIVLLNLCCGLRQLVRGVALFTAVLAACFSLQFVPSSSGRGASLDLGSMATINGKKDGVRLYLFFSASCRHCEKVIEALSTNNSCGVRFNPIEKIEKFTIPTAVMVADYDPQINRSLLQSLSINEVPVLLAKDLDEVLVIKGEKHIQEYLEKNCRQSRKMDNSGNSNKMAPGYLDFSRSKQPDDVCPVNTTCD
jgi:hypothetical protein